MPCPTTKTKISVVVRIGRSMISGFVVVLGKVLRRCLNSSSAGHKDTRRPT